MMKKIALLLLVACMTIGVIVSTASAGSSVPRSDPHAKNHPSDRYTITEKGSGDPANRWAARLGNGPDGSFTTDRDDYLSLNADVPSSKDVVAQWKLEHPGPHNVQWLPPARLMNPVKPIK